MRTHIGEDHTHEIDHVNAHVQQGPAGQGRIGDPRFAAVRVRQVRPDGFDRTDPQLAGAMGHFVNHHAAGLVPGPEGFGAQQALLLGQVQNLFGLFLRRREGFLHQDVLPLFQAGLGLFGMERMGGGDVDQVHFLIVQHVFVGAIIFFRPVIRGEFPCLLLVVPRSHCIEMHGVRITRVLLHAGQGLRHLRGDGSQA